MFRMQFNFIFVKIKLFKRTFFVSKRYKKTQYSLALIEIKDIQFHVIFRALIVHIVVFLNAIDVVWAGADGGQFQNDSLEAGLTIFASCALIAFVVQWIAFFPTYLSKTEHFYDLTAGATYLADNQKRIFKQQKNTHKEFIQTGL